MSRLNKEDLLKWLEDYIELLQVEKKNVQAGSLAWLHIRSNLLTMEMLLGEIQSGIFDEVENG